MKNNNHGTPHIGAKKGDFPKTVLFPGDPLRAKWVAETYFDNPKEVSNIRGILGFVGTYKGVKVSVMASGMGIPSAGIYSHELYTYYDVENIIRIGTAGGFSTKAPVGKIVIFEKAYSESTYHKQVGVEHDEPNVLYANKELVQGIKELADERKIDYLSGLGASNDAFYSANDSQKFIDLGIDAVEMEAFGIYANAKRLNKKAIAICTVSDNSSMGESLPPIDRQTKLKEMVVLALDFAVKYTKTNK